MIFSRQIATARAVTVPIFGATAFASALALDHPANTTSVDRATHHASSINFRFRTEPGSFTKVTGFWMARGWRPTDLTFKIVDLDHARTVYADLTDHVHAKAVGHIDGPWDYSDVLPSTALHAAQIAGRTLEIRNGTDLVARAPCRWWR